MKKMLHAWDSLQDENRWLKIIIFGFFGTSALLAIALMFEIERPPIVIERGCTTQVSRLGKNPPTDEELKSFIELALKSRFDSKPHDMALINSDQASFRAIEQKDLESQKMRQTLIVNSIDIKDNAVVADCDRLIAVGNVRSTFRFPIKVEFDSGTRSISNPYGLQLKRAEPVLNEVKK